MTLTLNLEPMKHLAEYALLRLMALPLRRLPYPCAQAWALIHAAPAALFMRKRILTARQRLRDVFGAGLTEDEVRSAAQKSWENLVLGAVDFIRAPDLSTDAVRAMFDGLPEAVEPLKEHLASGRGAILATPHIGCWELCCYAVSKEGPPVFAIAATQRNKRVEQYIDRHRASAGVNVISRGSGEMKEVIRRLRSGGVLAILPDVRMRTPGVEVQFLGGRANVGKGMALFARQLEIPVFLFVSTRIDRRRHRIRLLDTIQPCPEIDKESDILRITTEVMSQIDSAIRADPGQWFWYNSRWILDPLVEP